VKPERRFPAFRAGDAGVVVQVDIEADTCDVLFDGRSDGPVTVALKHLFIDAAAAAPMSPAAMEPAGEPAIGADGTGTTLVVTEDMPLGAAPDMDATFAISRGELHGPSAKAKVLCSPTLGLSPEHPHADSDSGFSAGTATMASELVRISVAGEIPATRARRVETEFEAECASSQTLKMQAPVRNSIRHATVNSMAKGPHAVLDDCITNKVLQLEGPAADQQSALTQLEVRVATLEAAIRACETEHSGRLVAARVTALEGAHQAEVADLRRSLDDAISLGREREHLERRQRASANELARQVGEVEHTMDETTLAERRVREAVRCLREDLARLAAETDRQESRVARIDEAVAGATAGLTRLGVLLEGKEKRIAEFGQTVSMADQDVVRFASSVEAQVERMTDLERRLDNVRSADVDSFMRPALPAQANDTIWQALRELQELVVHESEHRAAGLREVLGVLGQDIAKLRADQSKLLSDMDGRSSAERHRLNRRCEDLDSQHRKSNKELQLRIDALEHTLAAESGARKEAVACIECQLLSSRELCASVSDQPPAGVTTPGDRSACDALCLEGFGAACPSSTTDVLLASPSTKRLEILEARFDRAAGGRLDAVADAKCAGGTQGTLGKLRGQLEGLRSGIVEDTGAAGVITSTVASIANELPSPEMLILTGRAECGTDTTGIQRPALNPESAPLQVPVPPPSIVQHFSTTPSVQAAPQMSAQHVLSPTPGMHVLRSPTPPPQVTPMVASTPLVAFHAAPAETILMQQTQQQQHQPCIAVAPALVAGPPRSAKGWRIEATAAACAVAAAGAPAPPAPPAPAAAAPPPEGGAPRTASAGG